MHTAETTRVRFFMDMLIAMQRPVMLIGPAGSGKTVLMGDKLSALGEEWAVTNVPFNFYTTSEMLQVSCRHWARSGPSLGEEWAVTNVPFNFYTTSEMLQVNAHTF